MCVILSIFPKASVCNSTEVNKQCVKASLLTLLKFVKISTCNQGRLYEWALAHGLTRERKSSHWCIQKPITLLRRPWSHLITSSQITFLTAILYNFVWYQPSPLLLGKSLQEFHTRFKLLDHTGPHFLLFTNDKVGTLVHFRAPHVTKTVYLSIDLSFVSV